MVEASFDTWTSIFLIASFQGLFLAISLIFANSRRHQADLFLAGLVFSFSIVLAYYVSFWTKYNRVFPWIEGYSNAIPFLFGPFIYLYFKSLDGKRLSLNTLFHFIPFILHLIYLVPFLLLSGPEKLHLMDNLTQMPLWRLWVIRIIVWGQVIQMLIYGVLLVFLANGDTPNRGIASRINRKVWFTKLAWGFLFFALIHASYYIMVYVGKYHQQLDYLMSFGMSFLIYYIGYAGFKVPHFLGEAPKTSAKKKNDQYSPQLINSLKNKLNAHLNDQKPYLEGNLKLGELADQVGMKPHDLSQFINDYLGLSFSDFINQFRIRDAENFLLDSEIEIKIVDLASRCGFNTKTAFYNAFRKKNGISPLAFRKTYLNSIQTSPRLKEALG